jgi:hypoxanthine phosphoribosyltransferase
MAIEGGGRLKPQMDVLLSREEIARRVRELGEEVSAFYGDEEIHAIAILRGAVVFAADLIRHIRSPLTIDFMAVGSYGASTKSSGVVKILKDAEDDIAGRNVLLIEDIVDTGLTLRYLIDYLTGKQPKSLKVCALLDKVARRTVHVDVPFVGFTIPDAFVVGYGLDHAGRYRNLPDIVVLNGDA